jgi:hypothetical protein
VLALAACGGAPKPRAALDCPQTQGKLTRTLVAADGKTCRYVSPDGAEVTLQLAPVQGSVYATLDALETTLIGPPAAAAPAAATAAEPVKAEGQTTRDKALAEAAPAAAPAAAQVGAKDASAAEREAMQDAAAASSDVKVDVQGTGRKTVKIHGNDSVIVDEDTGETHVNLPGIHVDADDRTDSANVEIGPLHIKAGEEGATIKMRRDVRLRGEALSRERRGIRATFIAERAGLPDGNRFVAYEAGGPKVGPLAIAVVTSKSEMHDSDRLRRDVRRLVRENGGV